MSAFAVVEPVYDEVAGEQARLVNAARARLLRSGTAVTTATYIEALAERGVSASAARARIKRHRAASELVTIAHEGVALVPTFQLDRAFDLNPLAGEVVRRLTAAGWGAWSVWDWAETENGWIDNRLPADAIRAGDEALVMRALDATVA